MYASVFIDSVRSLYVGRNGTSHDCVSIQFREDLTVEETMRYGGALAYIARKMEDNELYQ